MNLLSPKLVSSTPVQCWRGVYTCTESPALCQIQPDLSLRGTPGETNLATVFGMWPKRECFPLCNGAILASAAAAGSDNVNKNDIMVS